MAKRKASSGVRITPAASESGDALLFTPGPLTTSLSVKQAMLHDIGSRDDDFIALNRSVRLRLLELVDGSATHTCVPLQGSGTCAVEALLATLLPRNGTLLNLINGAYGRRISTICRYLGRTIVEREWPEHVPVDPVQVDAELAADPAITNVSVVHCETTTGLINPLRELAEVVARHRRSLFVDAMSTLGALSISVRELPIDGIAASSNKCLEGSPGIGITIVKCSALEAGAGNAHSLSLDLHEQWRAMEANGQWRFTPPTHSLLALDQALLELEDEGGIAGRGQRYRENCRTLVRGMRALGFRTFLPDALQAPIIVTFHSPPDERYRFEDFYQALRRRGCLIYPGKLTRQDTFRIGCIGRLRTEHMSVVVDAVRDVIRELGLTRLS